MLELNTRSGNRFKYSDHFLLQVEKIPTPSISQQQLLSSERRENTKTCALPYQEDSWVTEASTLLFIDGF